MSEARHYILATAGHVDHGKSSLVKALTGIDPDRLPEEKARGITIDLGFAHLELPGAHLQDPAFLLGIVDVPGHEDFVKNMVAGVGSIDLALIVVAADDGWMPQTEEHLQILAYLGVRRAVVALTKVDLAEEEDGARQQVRDKLANSPFAASPIISTSVVSGRGIEELKAALRETLAGMPAPCDIGKPRLWVDRVFTLRGIGTVVTGTLTGGRLERGQAAVVQPRGTATRIRSIQSHNRDVPTGLPGTRTALNVPDVDAASQAVHTVDGVHRGNLITVSGLGPASNAFDVVLEKSGRLAGARQVAARPLRNGSLVRLHIGSTNVPTRVSLLSTEALEAGGRCVAHLRHESPLFAFAGDRFILRDWAEQHTLAGGLILDPDARRAGLRSPERRAFLERRADHAEEVAVFVETEIARHLGLERAGLLAKSRFSAAEIEHSVGRLLSGDRVLLVGEFLVQSPWWRGLCEKVAGLVDAAHRDHPELGGAAISELRTALERDLPLPGLRDLLIENLLGTGFVQSGTMIRRTTHRPALPPRLQAAGNRIRSVLAAKPLEPPCRKELAPDGAAQQALKFLMETGEVIEISSEVVLPAEVHHRMKRLIVEHLRRKGPATASELRQAIGTTRRILVPLLERLDREGVTRRDGDRRLPGPKA